MTAGSIPSRYKRRAHITPGGRGKKATEIAGAPVLEDIRREVIATWDLSLVGLGWTDVYLKRLITTAIAERQSLDVMQSPGRAKSWRSNFVKSRCRGVESAGKSLGFH